jgi:transcriptional regulator with XRE-family HTH domain
VADGSPTVSRRRLGLILRGLREQSGLTGEEVGSALDRSGSWVSRVETGRVGVRTRDLQDLLELYRLQDGALAEELMGLAREGKQRGWWSKYADTLAGPYATFIGFEAEASEVLTYEAICVPGLLQTEDYARALFLAGIPVLSREVIERRVEVRLERQRLLTGSTPLRVSAILDESVLLRQIGGPDVMCGQLKHLAELSRVPTITIQIVPFSAGAHPGMVGSFTVVRFPLPEDPDIVYVESVAGDIFGDSEDAPWYSDIFDHLRANALSPAETRQRIEQALD